MLGHSTRPAVGIDIGATKLHVALSADRRDPVHVIDLADPNWSAQLIELIPPGATVAFEPTGWHYSAPVVSTVEQVPGVQLVQVEHRVTGKIRDLRIIPVKTDTTDARALYYIATNHSAGTPLLGTHTIDPRRNDRTIELRLLVSDYVREVKERTRSTNRLHQLAHSVWPSLDQQLPKYLRAIEANAISPTQLRQLAIDLSAGLTVDGYQTPTARRNLIALVQTIPDWHEADHLISAIQREAATRWKHDAQATDLQQQIDALIDQEPFTATTAVWRTIPNASVIAIAALHVATHGNAATISPEQFKAAVGSHPRISQSGETKDSAASKQGYRPAKTALYLWTMKLIQDNKNPIAAAYHRHRNAAPERQHNIQAARSKLCIILSALARSGQPYRATAQDDQVQP